jgi:hypothetical protein
MTPTNESRSFWSTMPGILTAVGTVVTAIATLIGALAAAGVLGRGTTSTAGTAVAPVASQPANNERPTTTTTSPKPAVDRGSIDLVYTGDNLGCVLTINVRIGGQTVQPTGNRYTVRNVATGSQQYSIQGTISCTAAGVCNASGSGVVDVIDGGSYFVRWLNTSVGRCDVTLDG